MTDRCQCDWHKLQYCWLCEAESTDSDKDHKEDAVYLAHLADDANAPPLIELAETIR